LSLATWKSRVAEGNGASARCEKTLRQAEFLLHQCSQTLDPVWWRRRFRLRIACITASLRNLLRNDKLGEVQS